MHRSDSQDTRTGAAPNGARAGAGTAAGDQVVFPPAEAERLRAALREAVVGFVDSPERSVAEADALLEEAVARFTESLAVRRKGLRTGWQDGNGNNGADTERQRTLLLGYRTLMERLISV